MKKKAKTEKIAVIGDLHLNKMVKYIHNHIDLQFATLDSIMDRIKDKGIKKVILLGDVLDSPSVEIFIIIRLLGWIAKYPTIQFDWICGNHDKSSADSVQIDLIQYITKLGAVANLTIHIEPTKVGMISYLPYPHKHALKGTRLAIAHTDAPGARRDNGNLIQMEDTKWDKTVQFVIGHNHTEQIIDTPKVKAIFPGTPYQCSFGEKVDKFFGIMTVRESKKDWLFKYKKVPIIPKYRLINLAIETKSDFKKITPAPDFYKLTFAPGIKIERDFFLDNPNCFHAGSLPRYIEEDIHTDEDEGQTKKQVKIGITYGLKPFLTKRNLSDEEIKWGVKQVKRLIGKKKLLKKKKKAGKSKKKVKELT